MLSLLAGPIRLLLTGATYARIVSVVKGDWFFNESEKAELPAAFESVAKEAFLGVLFLVIFSGSRNNSALSKRGNRSSENGRARIRKQQKKTSNHATPDVRMPI